MTNDDDQDPQDAPPAVPEWEPGETAVRIASGHAGLVHFWSLTTEELARTVQIVLDTGRVKRRGGRALYWDPESDVAVIVTLRIAMAEPCFRRTQRISPSGAILRKVHHEDCQHHHRWGVH